MDIHCEKYFHTWRKNLKYISLFFTAWLVKSQKGHVVEFHSNQVWQYCSHIYLAMDTKPFHWLINHSFMQTINMCNFHHICNNITLKINDALIKKIISQFCRIGKDCSWNGNRLSKNFEKLPYLHKITKGRFFG